MVCQNCSISPSGSYSLNKFKCLSVTQLSWISGAMGNGGVESSRDSTSFIFICCNCPRHTSHRQGRSNTPCPCRCILDCKKDSERSQELMTSLYGRNFALRPSKHFARSRFTSLSNSCDTDTQGNQWKLKCSSI